MASSKVKYSFCLAIITIVAICYYYRSSSRQSTYDIEDISCCQQTNKQKLEVLCSVKLTVGNCTCTDYMMCKLVVVTAISSNHYEESQDFFGSVHQNMPNTTIIVYDVGLKEKERETLKTYCNVEVKTLNFSKYPTDTRRLSTYAFKGFVAEDASKENELFFFSDASVRIKKSLKGFLPFLQDFPFIPLSNPGYPMVITTHDGMIECLQMNMSRSQLIIYEGFQSGLYIMWTTKLAIQHIIKPYADCSRNRQCISPKGAKLGGCASNMRDRVAFLNSYGGCHRYDQSALNMILIREFGSSAFDIFLNTTKKGIEYAAVERHPTKKYVSVCKN